MNLGEVRSTPQKVVVMGLGLFGGGAAVARYFVERGAKVLVTDMRDAETLQAGIDAVGEAKASIEWVLGEHREVDFVQADLVVANPAVSPQNAFLRAARASGVRITSETELFLENCSARLAVITGTQGKSSTASMACQLLEASGFRAHLCGNVGRSLLEAADSFDPSELCVLEISSYQLEALAPRFEGEQDGTFENIAVVALTNVLEDHLERHGTLENYAQAKAQLFALPQRAFAIVPDRGLPAPAVVSRPGLERVPFATETDAGVSADNDSPETARSLWIEQGEFRLGTRANAIAPRSYETLGQTDELPLPGEFQKANALVALGIARLLGASSAALREAVRGLSGLSHRMEPLPPVHGRLIYDNGVSTTPDSTAAALEGVPEGSLLLCGGKAKSLSFAKLSELCLARSIRVVTFGAAAASLERTMQDAGVDARAVPELKKATAEALAWAAPGDTVLFSPACASFDAFPNFAARAQAFRKTLKAVEQDECFSNERALGTAHERNESGKSDR